MKFKLVEQTIDNTRVYVQDYMYDAMDELNNASLEEYIQWFKSELTYYDEDIEQAVTDAYIEACDYGMIKGVEKTRLTSELKEYIESHTDIIDDTDELMKQCPSHLQHELKIVLSKLDESLNENKGETDKRLIVDVINDFNTVTVNGTEYVLHHINGKKEDPRDRVTSNYLLIPVKYNDMSGDEIHLGLHRIARAYKDLDEEVSTLNEIPWLYVGTGHQLTTISAEEVVTRLKDNLPED